MSIKLNQKLESLNVFKSLNNYILEAENAEKKGDYQKAYKFYLESNKLSGGGFEDEVNLSFDNIFKKVEEPQSKVKVSSGIKKGVSHILNNYFDHIYVVNLKTAVEDRFTVTKQLMKNGIEYELFEAVNGYEEMSDQWEAYKNAELGEMNHFKDYSDAEISRGSRYISSAGAMGYISTYLKILKDIKKNKYKQVLILEDDVILDNEFEKKFKLLVSKIQEDWKIINLGASQYGWEDIDTKKALKNKFYRPQNINTCGSFAIAIKDTIVDELIKNQEYYDAPFDYFPIGELYEKYKNQCYVAFPNIIMPDVGSSYIRGGRNQLKHSQKMRWNIKNFTYPLQKISVSILLQSEYNLKYLTNNINSLPFDLKLYFNSVDGIRPLHDLDLLNKIKGDIKECEGEITLPESDFYLTLPKDEYLFEENIIEYLNNKLSGSNETNLNFKFKELDVFAPLVIKDRVSVIVPTYKRPVNLWNSINSIILQNYKDIEIIIVNDNGKLSEYQEETREVIIKLKKLVDDKPYITIKYIEHVFNRNGAAARNTGIFNSTGSYISFLDDDDIYLPNKIEKTVKKLKELKGDYNAVYCGFVGWNSPENDMDRYASGDLTKEILLLDYKSHYLCTNTGVYKKEAILGINGFNESYKRHQDLEFNIRYFLNNKIGVVKETLVKLSPVLSTIDNKVYGLDVINLKKKFLNNFDFIINKYSKEDQIKIYQVHNNEINRYLDMEVGNVTHVESNFVPQLSGAVDIVTNHLSYRLGKVFIEKSKSAFFIFTPIYMFIEVIKYKNWKANDKKYILPLKEYSDYEEAEQMTHWLSYEIGQEFLKCKNPLMSFLLPYNLLKVMIKRKIIAAYKKDIKIKK